MGIKNGKLKVQKVRLEMQLLYLGPFIIPKNIKYYSFLFDNIPDIGYAMGEERCSLYVYNGKVGSRK